MLNRFAVHGKCNISIEDSIIIIESTGPWNIEYFHQLHQNIVTAVSQVNVENYAILLVLHGEAICTHEVIKFHIDFLRQGNSKAVAVNLSQCDTPQLTKDLCCMVYKAAQLTFDFFDSNKQARIWLDSKLA